MFEDIGKLVRHKGFERPRSQEREESSPAFNITSSPLKASLVAQMVKNPPAMQETLVRSLDLEDPLELWLPLPVFLPGEFHGQRSLVGYCSWGHKQSDMTKQLTK